MKDLYEVTVGRGEDIHQVITEFILEHGWEEVFVVGAIGSIIESVYNAPIDNSIPMHLVQRECPAAAEVLSFTGEIMKRERMDENLRKVYPDKTSPFFLHIHASCVTGEGKIYGGGLVRGKAFRALRIFMTPV